MTVEYEWTIELLDEYGDILDIDHADTYKEAVERHKNDTPYNICLVRDEQHGCSMGGRAWAYVIDGILDPEMKDAYDRVECNTPKSFILQVEKVNGKTL